MPYTITAQDAQSVLNAQALEAVGLRLQVTALERELGDAQAAIERLRAAQQGAASDAGKDG